MSVLHSKINIIVAILCCILNFNLSEIHSQSAILTEKSSAEPPLNLNYSDDVNVNLNESGQVNTTVSSNNNNDSININGETSTNFNQRAETILNSQNRPKNKNSARSKRIRKVVRSDSRTCCGEKLFLTPYILQGKLEEAREAARVKHLPGLSTVKPVAPPKNCSSNIRHFNDSESSSSSSIVDNHVGSNHTDEEKEEVESYSGFLTINDKLGSNLFFWFFPAMENKKEAPLMLWLNGGPGSTSLVALFNEHGPFQVISNDKLEMRNNSWTSTHSIIYMDSPVGAGFSFTENPAGYALLVNDVVKDLYLALVQFLTIFSDYQKNDFYISGQSYAGKYVPALAHKIHEVNRMKDSSPNTIKINLKGISVGSGFFDPISQLNYGDFYYNTGLIDENQREYFEQQQDLTKHLIEVKNWTQAFIVLESLVVGYPTPVGTSYFEQVSGISYSLNILHDDPEENQRFLHYLHQESVRRSLKVGDQTFNQLNAKVYNLMQEDIYQSIKPKFVELLNADENYRVLIYSSQFDAIVPHTTVSNFLNNLHTWKEHSKYMEAKREIWKIGSADEDPIVAGYLKRTGNLIYAFVRNAGHLLPLDQPLIAHNMITQFTRNTL